MENLFTNNFGLESKMPICINLELQYNSLYYDKILICSMKQLLKTLNKYAMILH